MTFDVTAFKVSTKAQWNAAADRWNAWGTLLDTWLGPATETLLDMCNVRARSFSVILKLKKLSIT
mgnify:CR=1 FL=1